MDEGAVEADEIVRVPAGARFPATREELLRAARTNGAPGPLLDRLRALPEDRRYEGPVQAATALGARLPNLVGHPDRERGPDRGDGR